MNINDSLEIVNTAAFQPLQVSSLLDSAAVAGHPAIKALYQEAQIAKQNKKVERAQALPDFSVGYTNQSLTGYQTINNQDRYFGAGKRFSYVNVGIAIPLTFGANRARVQSQDYARQAAQAGAAQQQKALTAQLQNALQQYNQDLQQFQYYRQQALPNANEIVSAAQTGYRTGDIGYVEYLYALQTATDIRLNYLRSIQQINQSVIHIYSLVNQ